MNGTPSAALIVGAARDVWDDMRAAAVLLGRHTVFAVGEMVLFLPRVDHAVSHHGAELVHYAAARRLGNLPQTPFVTHSTADAEGIDRVWPPEFRVGDSGLLAARVALALGFERVVLAGVPIDASPHPWDDPAAPALDFGQHYRPAWAAMVHEFAGRVASMSGFTRELLGAPERLREVA